MDIKQRKEIRVHVRRKVQLHFGGRTIAATIFDISKSGVAVDVNQWVAVGAGVRITGEGFATEGRVRYCRDHLKGYRLGISRSTELGSSAPVRDAKEPEKKEAEKPQATTVRPQFELSSAGEMN
jgi:hypothetical protein